MELLQIIIQRGIFNKSPPLLFYLIHDNTKKRPSVIEFDLGGTADAAAEILLMDKYRMFFVHAYSADGKTIGEIVTKSIYGDNVTPATNNTIISIHVGSWDSGTAIISYTQGRPSLSIK